MIDAYTKNVVELGRKVGRQPKVTELMNQEAQVEPERIPLGFPILERDCPRFLRQSTIRVERYL